MSRGGWSAHLQGLLNIFFLKFILWSSLLIYLAASDLSCGKQDLGCMACGTFHRGTRTLQLWRGGSVGAP